MTQHSDLDSIVLNEFPHFLATRFKLMLDTTSFQLKVSHALSFFEVGLRTFTLGILSQYLYRDLALINDPVVNNTALTLMQGGKKKPALGDWNRLFFSLLTAYESHRERFFMPQLYDFYWNTTKDSDQKRPGVRKAFDKLVELRNIKSHAEPSRERGWEPLWSEIEEYLYEVIETLSFISDYDLIYIVEKQGQEYLYEVHSGLTIKYERSTFTGLTTIEGKWCYLAKKSNELLPIHPLILQWAEGENPGETESELVLFESYNATPPEITYWSVDGRRSILDKDVLSTFVRLVLQNLKPLNQYEEVSRLNLENVEKISHELTKKRMGDSWQKYNPSTYLQREKARDQFDDFLQSNSTCLVLLGNSGVGKTNFVLSLIDEFSASSSVHIFSFNGARLSPLGQPLEVLATEFNLIVRLRNRPPFKGGDIMTALADIKDISNCRIVIIIDSINENSEARSMLQGINDFVETYSSYPWLKLVIVSRPEAWRIIRQGLSLATQHFFRLPGEQQLGIELSGFDYGLRLQLFEYNELPLVYEKFRRAYNLETEYEDIPTHVKMMLRDPLALYLIAETYENGKIPEDVRITRLISEYIDSLKVSDPQKPARLDRMDIAFLQDEIVPRLFAPPSYPTILDPSSIVDERTKDDRPLYEMIYNDFLVGGKPVNSSYRNLADCSILTEQPSDMDNPIGFKYERFYEYFGGMYLYKSARESGDPNSYYLSYNNILKNKPYLWGALKNCISAELIAGNKELFVSLAKKVDLSDHLFRMVFVNALVEYGEINREDAVIVIEALIQPCNGPANSLFETLRRIIKRKSLDAAPLTVCQSIGIESAGRLGIEDVLIKAATDSSAQVRQTASLQIFYLWRDNADTGFRLMQEVSKHAIVTWGLPDFGTIDTLINLSIAFLTHNHLDQDIQRNVLAMARFVLRELLMLNQDRSSTSIKRLQRNLFNRIRAPLLSEVINWGVRILSEWSSSQPANIKTLSHLYTLSENEKDMGRKLLPYFSAEKEGLNNFADLIVRIEDTSDLLLSYYWGVPVFARHSTNYSDALAILRYLVDFSLSQDSPRPWIDNYVWSAFQIALRQPTPDPELFDLAERCVIAQQDDPYGFVKRHMEFFDVPFGGVGPAWSIGGYLILLQLYQRGDINDRIRMWVSRAIHEADAVYLSSYISELNFVFEFHFQNTPYHRVALEGLKLLSEVEDPQIQTQIAQFLSRVRRYYPDDVESLLFQEVFSKEINQMVWASSGSERLNDLFGIGAMGIFYDLFIDGPDLLQDELSWLANEALDSTNLKDFLGVLIGEILNLVAGQAVFDVPSDAPSKTFSQFGEAQYT